MKRTGGVKNPRGETSSSAFFKKRDEKSAGAKIPHLGQFQERDEKSAGVKSLGPKNLGGRNI